MKRLVKLVKSKRLSRLKFKEEFWAPCYETGDASSKITYEGRLDEYKEEFIKRFGNALVILRGDKLEILRCKNYKTWKKEYYTRKGRALRNY